MIGDFRLTLDVSRETLGRLDVYESLLNKWSTKINLVSRHTLENAAHRHFRDSAQIFHFIPKDSQKLIDLGSGGGFPGLVLAILAKELQPGLQVHLVESDQRKAAFLRTVARETDVSVFVHVKRIEKLDEMEADVITARALAPLRDLLGYAKRHLKNGGVCLFPKGQSWEKECDEAAHEWQFSYVNHISEFQANAVILEVRDLAHA